MTWLLIKKYVRDSILLFAACGLTLLVFCWARVWILSQFDLQQFQPLLDQFRPFERFSPVPLEQLLTYTGGLAMTFHEPVLILCIMVWSIARGSDVVSGEINRGTLEMLLAQPVSRLQLLLCHAVVCILGLGLLCGCVWLGLWAGIQTNSVREQVTPTIDVSLPLLPIRLPLPIGSTVQMETPLSSRVDASQFVAPCCNLFALAFAVWGWSVMCSAWDRYRWRTLGTVIGVYVIQLLLLLLSKATSATGVFGYATILSAYQPDATVHFARGRPELAWWWTVPQAERTASWSHGLGPLGLTGLLLALGCLFFVLACWRFRTRDIPAPL